MSNPTIEINVDGDPADVQTLDTFYRGIEGLRAVNDAAYNFLGDLEGATFPEATRRAFVNEHERLTRLMDAITDAKASAVATALWGGRP